jgi:hypothetical protein
MTWCAKQAHLALIATSMQMTMFLTIKTAGIVTSTNTDDAVHRVRSDHRRPRSSVDTDERTTFTFDKSAFIITAVPLFCE